MEGPTAINPQAQSRLLALPAELRTRIYELVLSQPPNPKGRITIRHDDERVPCGKARPSVLSLLRTCRLVYQEAAGIFYAQNELELYRRENYFSDETFDHFVNSLSGSRLNSIWVMAVQVICLPDAEILFDYFIDSGILHTLPSLEKVIIRQRVERWDLEFDMRDFKVAAEDDLSKRVKKLQFLPSLAFELDYWPHERQQELNKHFEEVLAYLPKDNLESRQGNQRWKFPNGGVLYF